MKNPALEPAYVKDIERAIELIPQWCSARDALPDLRFWTFGDMMFIAALCEPKWLAISPDAFELLKWLDAETGGKLTVYQAHFALEHLGFLVGAPVLTMTKLQEMGYAGTIMSTGGAA